MTTRSQKRPRQVEGRVEERGSPAPPEERGLKRVPPGLRAGQAQVPPASGRPKPQQCSNAARNSRRHRPFQLGRRLLTVLGLKETAGRRLTRVGRRQQTREEKSGEQGHYHGAARRRPLYERRRRRGPRGPWRHRAGGAGHRVCLTADGGPGGEAGPARRRGGAGRRGGGSGGAWFST